LIKKIENETKIYRSDPLIIQVLFVQ